MIKRVSLFLFLCGVCFNGYNAQDSDRRQRNKDIAAAKCREYTTPLNKNFEAIPLIAGGEPKIYSVPVCENHGEPLIIGGKPASEGEFPHMAAIGANLVDGSTLWFCGGTLISERYVLTAAHCISHRTAGSATKIRIGSINLEGSGPHLQEFGIEKIIKHEEYTNKKKYHDIALMRLDGNVRISKEVRPACLYTDDTSDSSVIATGWGVTSNAGAISKSLLKVGLDIYEKDNKQCKNFYSRRLAEGLTDNLICAGYKPGGRDTCTGDSGGPLVVTHEINQCIYYIVGITSFGIICAEPNVPSIYTKVAAYTDWIVEKVW